MLAALLWRWLMRGGDVSVWVWRDGLGLFLVSGLVVDLGGCVFGSCVLIGLGSGDCPELAADVFLGCVDSFVWMILGSGLSPRGYRA